MPHIDHPRAFLEIAFRKRIRDHFSEDDKQLALETQHKVNFLAEIIGIPTWKMAYIIMELGYRQVWIEYEPEIQSALKRLEKSCQDIEELVEFEKSRSSNKDHPHDKFAHRLIGIRK